MKSKNAPAIMAAMAFISILSCATLRAQTLPIQLKYTFADGPGTTTTNDPTSAVYPVVLNMKSATGTATDLHGAANSGVQNLGGSLNLNGNNIVGNANGAWAVITNDVALGAGLGVVSDFTATIWFKMPALFSNIANQGPRLWMIAPTGAIDLNAANTIGLQFGSRSAGSQAPTPLVDLNAFVGAVRVTPSIYYDFPTNVWLYCAMVYDSVGGNCYIYYGSEASPAKLYAVRPVPPGTSFDLSAGASLAIGNRISQGRDFIGSISDFRFYKGVGSPTFVENVRREATPVGISNLTPDGSILQNGTNTLTFTANSTSGIATSNIKVLVNGADVSANLLFSGPPTAVSVTYTNLPVNPSVLAQSIINAVTVSIKVTDNAGIVTTNSYAYDAFDPRNYSFEAEDFDFGSGLFIDNPVVSFVGFAANTYYQEQTPYVSLVDANDNGAAGGPLRVYRDPTFPVETEFSIGTGNNGGNSIGELMRQKVLDAFAITNIANEVNVGFFDGSGAGPGFPNWMNYTRTFSNGNYNIYLRVADGGGNISAALDEVTGNWGTTSQTTTNLGTFNIVNSGGWDTFSWVPLRDPNGNLVRVQLNGTNTLRLTAGAGGGGNVNFLMLTAANTNLPSINGIYPNGTNMFQPSPTLSFVASSASGFSINTNSIKVRLTVTNLLGQGFVTNLTGTNGLNFSGPPANLLVTTPLTSNSVYTAVISIADTNGSSAGTTVSFDTLSPTYTWEAPDYDYGQGQFIPDPIPTNGYSGLFGAPGVDYFYANTTAANTYRDSTAVGIEPNGDFPLRLQYITNSPVPPAYDIGFYNGGNWLNYTRNYPTGVYNIYVRAADGSTGGALGNVVVSVITNIFAGTVGAGTNIGNFNIPVTGGWQTYTWVPLRDSSGNLVKFSGGTTNTLRATSAGSQNVFFYALFPANTNLPILGSVFPLSGTQLTNTFSFAVQSSAGVASNKVVVTVNGITVSNLVFTGTINAWTVTYPHLAPNTSYVITVAVTDVNGNSSTTSSSFDTINPNNYTWEAEDFDHDGGLFIDNPQTNAYLGLGAITNVDAVQVNFATAGAYTYRSLGSFTAVNGDIVRPQFQDINNPLSDYEIGFFSDGAWANYTRHYPAGSYNIYGRFATASATGTDAQLAQVTDGWGTETQTTNLLGSFNIPATGGWETYAYVPMRDSSGRIATVTFTGSTNTLRLIRPLNVPISADVNVNFLMLVPVLTVNASQVGTNVVITFPTLSGFSYQVQYKTNLTDPAWISLGSPIAGNNGNKSLSDPDNKGGSRFYRVLIP